MFHKEDWVAPVESCGGFVALLVCFLVGWTGCSESIALFFNFVYIVVVAAVDIEDLVDFVEGWVSFLEEELLFWFV